MKKTILVGAALAAALMTRESPAGGLQQRHGPPPAKGERFVAFTGSSYDPATRTCEATFATGEVVSRSWYTEQLRIDAESVDLRRVPLNQVRLLFNHQSGQVIGFVQVAEIQSGVLAGRLCFAKTEAGDLYAGMVERGELTGISVGYLVHQWTRVSDDQADKDEWIATRWELMEVSLVPVPADPFAGVRSADLPPGSPATPNHGADPGAGQRSQEEEDMLTIAQVLALRSQAISLGVDGAAADAILAREGITHAAALEAIMTAATEVRSAATTTGAAAAVAAAVVAATPAAPPAAAVMGASDVLALRGQGIGLGLAETAVDEILGRAGLTREQASSAILAASADAQRAATSAIPAGGAARVGVEAAEKQRDCMVDALSARMSGATPTEAGRQFAGWTVMNMWAERSGINERDPMRIYDAIAGRGSMELSVRAGGMMSTSDFPLLLEAAANKTLLAAYILQQPTYRQVAAKKSFNDFKPQKFYRVGDFPELLPLGEGGEIKAGAFKESRETAALSTSARLVTMTRQMLINDDLSAFGDFSAGAGRAAARRENAMFYALLLANSGAGPKLADGKAMFHVDHANLAATGGAIAEDTLSEARKAGRTQKDIDGHALNAEYPILLLGPNKETEAEKVLVDITPTKTSDVNIFAGKRRIVSDAAITDNAWWNFADPSTGQANFVYGYLRDTESPQVRQDKPFNYDGMGFGVIHDFGVGAIDSRFGFKNPGN